MTPEQKNNVNALLQALESGDYQQGKGRLALIQDNDDVHYCCLGVACEVAIKRGLKIEKETLKDMNACCIYDTEVALLPKNVMEYYGFSHKYGEFERTIFPFITYRESLASMNDKGESFSTIANTIRKQLKKRKSSLFTR